MRSALFLLLAVLAVASGCAAPASSDEDAEAADEAVVSGDTAPVAGIPSAFDKNRVLDDAFYTNTEWATQAEIQHFLENTVWNRASWLATQRLTPVGSTTPVLVSEAIVRAARAHGINPLLLLARMQVEKSLVAATNPSSTQQSFGLGCHRPTAAHPNGLDPSVAPLNIQLECGASTLETQIGRARDGENNFTIGRATTTQDGVAIRPSNAATSALYAYTPIEGTHAHNGNWLVWNITHRFAAAIQAARGPR